uniref:UNC93-like protein MFSD11 n=1 Tax=Meloidogyne enterolobii TaxID=390850 RepID=A0A6V7XTD6_MELEN|nr:unnamed protein product [Meloidogyne enterolobii]
MFSKSAHSQRFTTWNWLLFYFLAFNSQGFIEESVLDGYTKTGQVDKHAGYTSLSIIYASFTVCNFVAPPIIRLLGTRTSLVTAGLVYVLFLAGFLNVHQWFLYATSALLGLAAAVLWTAQGKYLTLNSTPQSAGRHSSLFCVVLKLGFLSCGGLFLLIVFLLASGDVNNNQILQSNKTTTNNTFLLQKMSNFFTAFLQELL